MLFPERKETRSGNMRNCRMYAKNNGRRVSSKHAQIYKPLHLRHLRFPLTPLQISWSGSVLTLLPPPIDSTSQIFHPPPKSLHDITYMLHLIELDLQLIDLSQNFMEARDFGVSVCDCGACGQSLCQGRGLGLCRELWAEEYELANN